MFFTASKTLGLLLDPINLLILVGLAGLVFHLLGARRAGIACLALVTGGLVLPAATPLPEALVRPLEARFPKPVLPERVDGIIMLGGAQSPTMTMLQQQLHVNDAAERLILFVELARRYPEAKLVASGGSGNLLRPWASEATTTRLVLEAVGFDVERPIFEDRSRNTFENAVFSKELAQPQLGETWLLVTSAFHMPRAVAVFRAQNWPVMPFPVDYRVAPGNDPLSSLDPWANLDVLRYGIKEWAGLVAYRLAGYTREIFPAP